MLEWLTKLFGCGKNVGAVSSPWSEEAGTPSESFISGPPPFKTHWAPSLGFMRDKYEDRHLDDIRGIVFHSTGGGLYRRWKRDNPNPPSFPVFDKYDGLNWAAWVRRRGQEATPFDTAVRVYASMMYPGPHFVVCGQTGRVAHMCPLDKAAWHVGRKGRKAYEKGVTNKEWLDYWWHLPRATPLALLGGHDWFDVNNITIGVEISPPRRGARAALTPNALKGLSGLVSAIVRGQFGEVSNFIPREETLVTHWDVHPNTRSLKNGEPWDLPWTQWQEKEVYRHILKPALDAYQERRKHVQE